MRLKKHATTVVDGLLIAVALIATSLAARAYFVPQKTVSVPHLELGARLEPFKAVNSETGEETNVSFVGQGSSTLVIVYRSTCPFCEANASKWAAVVGNVSQAVSVIAVATDSAGAWTASHGIAVKASYRVVDMAQFAQKWRLAGVPMTILVSENGKVLFEHLGVLTDADLSRLQRLLKV